MFKNSGWKSILFISGLGFLAAANNGCIKRTMPSGSSGLSSTKSLADVVTKNPWWPLVPGNSWTLKKSDNGHPLTIIVEPIQPTFGCGNNPIHLNFVKTDADAYWGPGSATDLQWFLGVQGNGDLMGYGYYTTDFSGNPQGGTMNFRSINPDIPAYFLIPGNVTNNQTVSNRHALPTSPNITDECLPNTNNYYSTWNVNWTYTTVSVPAYSGPALLAHYDEQTGGGRQIENWYFAQGIGITRIETEEVDGTTDVDMQLASYSLMDASTINAPPVSNPVTPSIQLAVGGSPNPPYDSPTAITVNVGDHIYYSWTSQNAATVNSFYVSDGPDNCPGGFVAGDTSLPWVATTTSGTNDHIVQSCQAGHTYSITAQATSSTGNLVPTTIYVIVNPIQAEPAPVATLSLSPPSTSPISYEQVNVNQNVSYYWTIQNAGTVQSYYYASSPDTCSGGYNSMSDVTLPWIISSPASGNFMASSTIGSCQGADTYTMVLIATSPSGTQVARSQIVISVTGSVEQQMNSAASSEPQSWYVWNYYYNLYSGQSAPSTSTYFPGINFSVAQLSAPEPLSDWWNCTQATPSNCTNLYNDLLAAAVPTSTPTPTPPATGSSPTPTPSFDSPPNINTAATDGAAAGSESYVTIKGQYWSGDGNPQDFTVSSSNCIINLNQTYSYSGPDGSYPNDPTKTQVNLAINNLGMAAPFSCNFTITRDADGAMVSTTINSIPVTVTLFTQMLSSAAPSTSLDFDQWNFYYNLVTGNQGADAGTTLVEDCVQGQVSNFSGRPTPMSWATWCYCMNQAGDSISCTE